MKLGLQAWVTAILYRPFRILTAFMAGCANGGGRGKRMTSF